MAGNRIRHNVPYEGSSATSQENHVDSQPPGQPEVHWDRAADRLGAGRLQDRPETLTFFGRILLIKQQEGS
jgi:hypothetical protein